MTSDSTKTPSTNPFKDDMTGRVLLGRYRIVRKLAAGGMGVVYLARTEGARGFVKPVVVKLILPTFSSDESFLKMFVREAQILSKLNDPGIVSVIDFEQEKDFYIMVLEYVHGFQLNEWLKYRESKNSPLPTNVAIQIILKVLEPLHHAHTLKNDEGKIMGIVHQDISPSNILLNTDGRIKLLDFGIAKMKEGGEDTTTAGTVGFQGKLSYSAPERFAGKAATVKCDVYSVGVTLHQLLVGRNEFFAKSHANTIAQVLHHTPSSVVTRRADAPLELDAIIQKALAKDPDYRYTTALDFANALRPLLTEDPREIDEQISEMVAQDFTADMANFLQVEPLELREKAWRQPSMSPPSIVEDESEDTRQISGREMQGLMKGKPVDERTVSMLPNQKQIPEMTVSLKQAENKPAFEIPILAKEEIPADFSSRITVETPIDDDYRAQKSKTMVVSARALIAIVVIVLLAAGGVIAFQHFDHPPPSDQNKIVLVQSPVEDPPHPPSDIPPAAQSETATVGDQKSDSPQEKSAEDTPVAKRNKKSARPMTKQQKQLHSLTSAFKKQKNKVKACFKSHADALTHINQISVVFSVNPNGSVKNAGIQPPSINKTALGPCIQKVAAATKFPPQKSPVTFTIPVRVQK